VRGWFRDRAGLVQGAGRHREVHGWVRARAGAHEGARESTQGRAGEGEGMLGLQWALVRVRACVFVRVRACVCVYLCMCVHVCFQLT
jgi:hypothetical protein